MDFLPTELFMFWAKLIVEPFLNIFVRIEALLGQCVYHRVVIRWRQVLMSKPHTVSSSFKRSYQITPRWSQKIQSIVYFLKRFGFAVDCAGWPWPMPCAWNFRNISIFHHQPMEENTFLVFGEQHFTCDFSVFVLPVFQLMRNPPSNH